MHAPLSAQRITPAVSLATVQRLVERGKQAHPDLATRMDKAAALLVTRSIECGESGRVWYVQSERHPDTEYPVTPRRRGPWRCTCADFARRHDWCKHGLAVALLQRCQAAEGPEPPAPIAFPPPHDYPDDAPIPYWPTDLLPADRIPADGVVHTFERRSDARQH